MVGSFTAHPAEEMLSDVGMPGAARSQAFYSFVTAGRVCVERQDNRRSSPMRIIDATALSGFARKTAESASDIASVVHNLIMDVRDSYRPELHYMRGPGPKWRAKHQPWPGFDSEAVPPAGQHQLSPAHVRGRDAANPTR
jgi:hypothetical protein